MDTFTVMVAATALALNYFGERFRAGIYLLFATIFVLLFAWRMGEETFYIGSAVWMFTLVYRAFFKDEDIRESETNTEGE